MPFQLRMMYPGRAKPKYPNINLSSANIRTVLTSHIVKPVAASNGHVVAFRLVWRGQETELDHAWKNIIHFRNNVDEALKLFPAVAFFISAVTGTVSIHSRTDQPTGVYPALAYWVVGQQPDFDESRLLGVMMQNGLGANVRQITQRRKQTDPPDPANSYGASTLFMVVKDYGKGYVRDKMDSAIGTSTASHPAVKCFVHDTRFSGVLAAARENLHLSGFKLVVENY